MGDASLEDLTTPPADGANPAAWIIWHLARVQDHHVAGVAGAEQLWVTADWPLRFGLRPDANDTGNRHSAEQVRGVRPDSVEALLGYLDAVAARTRIVLGALTDDDLDRVVDTSYDPPVTVGVRLVSVANDNLQHAGQVGYVLGPQRLQRTCTAGVLTRASTTTIMTTSCGTTVSRSLRSGGTGGTDRGINESQTRNVGDRCGARARARRGRVRR